MDVSMATKHDASANEKTTISKSIPFDEVRSVVFCFPLSPYVYTSTINSQSKATFNCKQHSTPQCICPVLRFWHHRKWRFRWAGVHGTYRTSRQEIINIMQPPEHGKTRYRLEVVRCMRFVISPAACSLFLIDITTITIHSVICSCRLKCSPRSWLDAVSDFKFLDHTSYSFFQIRMILQRVKSSRFHL